MADNSSMRNVTAVEQYGENLKNVNEQMLEIFTKMNQQTQELRVYWEDDMYEKFAQNFDQNILKLVQEISSNMEVFAKYVDEMCKLHRMAQQKKYY